MPDHVERRTGTYVDSVSLMQVSRAAATNPGVDAAQVAMATELNLDVIRGMGFTVPEGSPNDLLVAVRGSDEQVVGRTLGHVEPHAADDVEVELGRHRDLRRLDPRPSHPPSEGAHRA